MSRKKIKHGYVPEKCNQYFILKKTTLEFAMARKIISLIVNIPLKFFKLVIDEH